MASEDVPHSEIATLYEKVSERGLTLYILPGHNSFLAVIGSAEFLDQFDMAELAYVPIADLIEHAKFATGCSPSEAGHKAYDIWATDMMEEHEPDIKRLHL